MMIIDYAYGELLPEHMRDGTKLYIEQGIPPGGFLTAVIENDLVEACGRADHINKRKLTDIVSWFYNVAPSNCWGSPRNFQLWRGMDMRTGKPLHLKEALEHDA